MAPNVTADTRSRHDDPRSRFFRWWMPLIVVVAVAWLATARALFVDTAHISRLTVVNPTAYDIDVALTDGSRSGWLTLGEANRHATTSFREISDQGQIWIARFADGEAGELRITRRQLEQADWRIEIPRAVEGRLRATWGPPELLAD
jgi:hypothetical protein